MKRNYDRPVMEITRFLVNENVATSSLCGTTTYTAVPVSCLISGTGYIYATGTNGCEVCVDGTAGSSYCFFTASDGCVFLIWPTGYVSTSNLFTGKSDSVTSTSTGSNSGHSLNSVQKEAIDAGYITSSAGNAYHIAPITSAITGQIARS